jgi:hypothetical protein
MDLSYSDEPWEGGGIVIRGRLKHCQAAIMKTRFCRPRSTQQIAGHALTTPEAEKKRSLLDIYLAKRKKIRWSVDFLGGPLRFQHWPRHRAIYWLGTTSTEILLWCKLQLEDLPADKALRSVTSPLPSALVIVRTPSRAGDVEHHQHAMTTPGLGLSSAEPLAHYRERQRRLFANTWSHTGPVVRIPLAPPASRSHW